MASTSEVGHAKNVANFQDLLNLCTGFGTIYSPTKTLLQLPALHTLGTAAQTRQATLIPINNGFDDATDARINAFDGINTLSTRVIYALEVTDATPEKIANAKGFKMKLEGRRAAPKNAPIPPTGGTVTLTDAPDTISVSQLSYDQVIEHFSGLITVAESEPSYAPNEADLTIDALKTRLAAMQLTNNAVSVAQVALDNARNERDHILYDSETGLVDIASEVKKYIKSIFGGDSSEYQKAAAIEFRKVPR